MKSRASRRFWRLFAELPAEVQRLASKNYELWREDPLHPSLRFRPLQGHPQLFTTRIGDHYRALAVIEEDCAIWVWIGSHADNDRMIQR